MGHHHTHRDAHIRVPPEIQRLLLVALAPFVIATIVGLIVLWPTGRGVDIPGAQVQAEQFKASVSNVRDSTCPDIPGQGKLRCFRVTVRLDEGPDENQTFGLDYSTSARARGIENGDRVIVAKFQPGAIEGGATASGYSFVDFDRRTPLLVLVLFFGLVVVVLSRWQGIAALAGLGVTLLVLVKFALPAILEGENPLAVAAIAGATIMFLALYLAHGINASTTIAVLGTLASLALTGLLALVFVAATKFTGVGSEEATFLGITQGQVNLQGLLLGSIIIGTLGVLDDVTVTQSSAVWELRKANPDYTAADLYRAAIRIGRDHIASTVNTLVLAYAGASLPLLVLFTISNRSLGEVINTEVVAEEVVRTMVGSIGLVASVPITTGLASLVVSRARLPRRPAQAKLGEDMGFKLPRAEREWRAEPDL